jgi:phenylpropionate dioxygenase-like ring-hydroxylating dioxygenase large terminal subunit
MTAGGGTGVHTMNDESGPSRSDIRNYPLRCWWVAARSEEVGRSMLARWLLDTPVLLFRTLAGNAVAIENRCPHRATPLSLGRLEGDEVICGYHGFQYDSGGRCTKIPSQSHVPPSFGVRSFPVIERPPFVWIYLGDRESLAAIPEPPRLDWTEDPDFSYVTGHMTIAGNYMLLKENVLDLTHFGYVHAGTFGISDWVNPPEVSVDDEVVTYRQAFTDSPLAPVYALAMEVPSGTPFNRNNWGSFLSPALQSGGVDFKNASKDSAGRGNYRIRVCHATTPIDMHHMEYFWAFGRDHGTSPEMMTQLRGGIMTGFNEDKAIIEAVQQMLHRVPFSESHKEVHVRADTAGVQARRSLERWMAREERRT